MLFNHLISVGFLEGPKQPKSRTQRGTKANMTRTQGWRWCGEPLKAPVPHSHWRTTTFLAALRNNAIPAPLVLVGPMNGATLVPTSPRCGSPHSSQVTSC